MVNLNDNKKRSVKMVSPTKRTSFKDDIHNQSEQSESIRHQVELSRPSDSAVFSTVV